MIFADSATMRPRSAVLPQILAVSLSSTEASRTEHHLSQIPNANRHSLAMSYSGIAASSVLSDNQYSVFAITRIQLQHQSIHTCFMGTKLQKIEQILPNFSSVREDTQAAYISHLSNKSSRRHLLKPLCECLLVWLCALARLKTEMHQTRSKHSSVSG